MIRKRTPWSGISGIWAHWVQTGTSNFPDEKPRGCLPRRLGLRQNEAGIKFVQPKQLLVPACLILMVGVCLAGCSTPRGTGVPFDFRRLHLESLIYLYRDTHRSAISRRIQEAIGTSTMNLKLFASASRSLALIFTLITVLTAQEQLIGGPGTESSEVLSLARGRFFGRTWQRIYLRRCRKTVDGETHEYWTLVPSNSPTLALTISHSDFTI